MTFSVIIPRANVERRRREVTQQSCLRFFLACIRYHASQPPLRQGSTQTESRRLIDGRADPTHTLSAEPFAEEAPDDPNPP